MQPREYGTPCVVNAKGIVAALKDGDRGGWGKRYGKNHNRGASNNRALERYMFLRLKSMF